MSKFDWHILVLGMVFAFGSLGLGAASQSRDRVTELGGSVFSTEDGAVIVASSVGLIRTVDGGVHWQKLGVEPGWLLPQRKQMLLVGAVSVMVSDNGGLSWKLKGNLQKVPWSGKTFSWPHTTDERGWLYFCHDDALLITPDAGVSWIERKPPNGCSLARVRGQDIHVIADGVVQWSRDGGLTWKTTHVAGDVSRRVVNSAEALFVVGGSRGDLLVHTSSGEFFVSQNGGKKWRRRTFGGGTNEKSRIVDHIPGRRDVIYFSLDSDERVVYRTMDGIVLSRLGVLNESYYWRLTAGQNGELYLVDGLYVHVSNDEGQTWKRFGRGGIDPPGTALPY